MNDPMRLFDRPAHRRHRDRASATVDRVAPVLRDAAERLLDRLDDTTRRFTRALDIGQGCAVAGRHSGPQIGSTDDRHGNKKMEHQDPD